jgi:hypothetical protein
LGAATSHHDHREETRDDERRTRSRPTIEPLEVRDLLTAGALVLDSPDFVTSLRLKDRRKN